MDFLNILNFKSVELIYKALKFLLSIIYLATNVPSIAKHSIRWFLAIFLKSDISLSRKNRIENYSTA